MKSNKGLIIALLLSLIANGIMVGIYIGQQALGRDRWAMREMSHKLLKGAPAEFNDDIRQAMYAHKDELRDAFKTLRRARWEMVGLLKSDPVSQAQLTAGFNKVRRAEDALKSRVHAVLAEVLPTVPPENRLKVAMWHDQKMQLRDQPRLRPPGEMGPRPGLQTEKDVPPPPPGGEKP